MTESSRDDVTGWLFRGLMFEAAAEQFRSAGIRVGADTAATEAELVAEALAPFPVDVRAGALRMSRLYALLNCFENALRDLIRERLMQAHATEWWSKGVPDKVRKLAESRKEKAEANTWLEGEARDPLSFADFGDLAKIIIQNWDAFADQIPSQAWLNQRMDELEQARNFIAHSRILQPGEFRRFEMYVGDWVRQLGW